MLGAVLLLAAGMLQQDWYVYEPDGKNLRVELPSKPNSTSSRTVNSAAGRSQVTTAQLKTPDTTYSIQLTESPARINPRTLDDGIQKFAAASQAVLGDIATITIDDQPGREFEMTEKTAEGQKHSKMRWLAVGNSLLMLTVTAKPGTKLTPTADRFLGSLEFGPRKAVTRAPATASESPRTKAGDSVRAKASNSAQVKPEEFVPGDAAGKSDETEEDKSKAEAKPARKLTTLTKISAKLIPKTMKPYAPEDMEDLPRSYLMTERNGFRDVGPVGSVLVGVRVSYIERFGGPKIRSVQPIYRSGANNYYLGRVHGDYVGPFATFVAAPGYAVGGLVTHTGLTVDGFGMVFMKVNGDHLEPDDTYNSPWIGDKKGGSPGGVTSQGGLVIGLQGRSEKEVNALGLTTLK